MSWCDRLTSTPAVGIFLDPHFGPSEDVLRSITPILNREVGSDYRPGQPVPFSITHQDGFRVDVQFDDGFLFSIEPAKISLTFQHRMRLRATSGGLPIAQLISQPLTYTKLLDMAIERLLEAALLLPRAKDRHVTRIGIVSITNVVEEDVPPGIRRFIDYNARPWDQGVLSYSFTNNVELRTSEHYIDKCIHNIKLSEDEDRLVNLNFDWQRLYTKPFLMQKSEIEKETETARGLSLAYFEELAIGERFDGIGTKSS